jgi:hypothetical protein
MILVNIKLAKPILVTANLVFPSIRNFDANDGSYGDLSVGISHKTTQEPRGILGGPAEGQLDGTDELTSLDG